MRELKGDHSRYDPLFPGPLKVMRVAGSDQRGQRWIAEGGKMAVGMGGGCNPLHTTVTVTLFPYPLNSLEKVAFVPENTDTHTVRDGSATVAAGHTSGGTVGQWTRVGERKMNQVAQHCLMISEGMGWVGGGQQISFMSVSLTWGLAGCVCVCACV